jgi:hypothetical protein
MRPTARTPGYFPYGEDPRYDGNALNTVAEDLTENPDQPFDVASTSLCDDLAQMWIGDMQVAGS